MNRWTESRSCSCSSVMPIVTTVLPFLSGIRPSVRYPGLFGQAQSTLTDDVPLDLAGAGEDRAGPAAEEHALPRGDRVAVPVRPQQAVRALDADRDLAQALVVFAPEQLGHRGLRARRATRGQLGQGAQAGEAHQLDLRVGPRELLADQRVGGLPALAGRLHQLPELPLEAEVRHRRPAA